MAGPMADVNFADRLRETARGFMEGRILLLGVELGVFDRLAEGPADAETLARELELQPRGVQILLEALVALRYLTVEDGRFANTEGVEQHVVRGRAGSMGHILGHYGTMFRSWARLDDIVRHGQSVDEREKATLNDPEANRNFILGMAEVSRGRVGRVLDRLPLTDATHLVDVGGGPAQYACAAVKRHPRLRATLVDLPLTVSVAREYIADQGCDDRVDTLVCDFYHEPELPLAAPADVMLISQVFHAEGAEENAALLKKVTPHLRPGGHVAVCENLRNDDRVSPPWAAVFGVNMLAGTTRGNTYTEAEIAGWLRAAGLEPQPVVHIEDRTALILAQKPA